MFRTWFNSSPDVPETNTGERITESAGYIPLSHQITAMMYAGEQLDRIRRYGFDSDNEDYVDGDIPIYRRKNVDLSEVYNEYSETAARLAKQARENQTGGISRSQSASEASESEHADTSQSSPAGENGSSGSSKKEEGRS